MDIITKRTAEKVTFAPLLFMFFLLALWQGVCTLGWIPDFLLPSPVAVGKALIGESPLLLQHGIVTLLEAFCGLGFALLVGFLLGIGMDQNLLFREMISPLLVLTQTVPVIALAPLLILWMGLGVAPKIVLVFLTCFFPITMGLLNGFSQADPDTIRLLKSMGATRWEIYRHYKLPGALPSLFSGIRVATTYALVGAVVAEWVGGDIGLGVYMTRVRKNFAMDKLFAAIFVISLLSILLVQLVGFIERKSTPWRQPENHQKANQK